jgi:diguanylate cyclase (GGDEF)-like protein/PAS domain S-box-containing protein
MALGLLAPVSVQVVRDLASTARNIAHEPLSGGRHLPQRSDETLERLELQHRDRVEALQRQGEVRAQQLWWGSCVLLIALIAVLAWLYWFIKRSEEQSRRALAALAESEARFRNLTELSADWYWEQDDQLRIRFLSSAYSKGGREVSRLLGRTRWDVQGVDLASADWQAHQATCRSHEPFRDFVYRRVDDDGSAHWIRVSGEPLLDDQGVFKGYRGVASDVTLQKRAEQELIRRQDLYAALSQTNRAIIHIHEPQALFEEVCRVAVEHGHMYHAWIGLLNQQTASLQPMAAHGPVNHLDSNVRASVDPGIAAVQGFAAAAMREGRHCVVNDFLAEPRAAPWHEQARASGIKSLATFPLLRAGSPAGVLSLHGNEVGFFTDDLVELLQEMAGNISYALTNMQHDEERAATQQALVEGEGRFRQLASNIPGAFWSALPGGGAVTYVSPAYDTLCGRSREVLLKDPGDWINAVHPEDLAAVESALRKARDGRLDHEFRIQRADGQVRWIHNRSFPVLGENGKITLISGIAEDITARKEDEELLQYMARYDHLTGLPNRMLFYDRLQQSLAHSRRDKRPAAVVFIDLDHFKRVNDTLGHAVGDELLQEAAQRIKGALRAGDSVGRLSGDEFAAILTDLTSAEDAAKVTRTMMAELARPFFLEGHEVFVSASAGITLYPNDGEDPDMLIRNADTAMYRAKDAGRNTFQFFRAEMNTRALERLSMDGSLRRALERNEFLLHYQPKVALSTGAITGLEALLRWQHPERGLVSPANFIPLLEDNGLIVPVGAWVIAEACRQIKAWGAQGIPVVPIAVNLSGRQMHERDLGRSIEHLLREHGVDPRLIELEITESVLMGNAAQSGDILRQLKKFGIRLSVDDFGTGYSSLGYLKSFPLDALKIDRSFVRDITTDPDDAMITSAVISLAHSLRLKVVAEGVETEAQLSMLAAKGCDEMQGYYYAKPMPASECGTLMRKPHQLLLPARATDGARTLLLVDDDPAILSLMSRMLRHEGFRILTAQSGEQALNLLAANLVGVVIADQRMPNMSGVELLSRVKGLYPDTVRVVMSAQVDVDTVTEAINQGAVYKVLAKPWDDDVLRATLRDAFAQQMEQDAERGHGKHIRAV